MQGQKFEPMKRVSGAAFAVVMSALFLGSPAQAGETEVVARYVNGKPDAAFAKVGDAKGHVVGSFRLNGILFHPDEGELPRLLSGNFEFTDGVGPVWGYTTIVYKDKSTSTISWQGEKKRYESKEFYSEGTLTCVAGTGRFKDAKCEGTWATSKYLSNGMMVGETKIKLTLPD